MATHVPPASFVDFHAGEAPVNREAHSSGVSWGAVIGGAFVAAALYLILLALGAGFGLSVVSLWSNAGVTASTAGTLAIVWLVLIEVIASAFGGYLTGRLRTKWTMIHSDEVYFRDTANGFLAWAVAFVVSVACLASGATAMAGSAEDRAASGTTVSAAANTNMYFVDELFRSDRVEADAATKAEAGRILVKDLKQDRMTAANQNYLARLVAARTGITESDAERRVADVSAEARQAGDAARETTAHFLLWSFLSLLLGAFSASFAATIGGRQRDHVKSAI